MLVIPSLDLQNGRSRLVFWPGAASGTGTPTDKPDQISHRFVDMGAPLMHLVDLDGARQGRPVNTAAIQAVARAVATPLQVAGGIDGPDQIELAFAAGATRVVIPLWLAVGPREQLAACIRAAGDWLAVGLEARPERLAEYPWGRPVAPTIDEVITELLDAGVRRFVLSHATPGPDLRRLVDLASAGGAELLVAGGITELAGVSALRDAGVTGVILGEVIFTGAIDYTAALGAAA